MVYAWFMENNKAIDAPPAGWVFGNFDGFPGKRIYPSWMGALESKRLICQDIRVQGGEYFIHSPWKNQVIVGLGTDIAVVESYILQHGQTVTPGANVWD